MQQASGSARSVVRKHLERYLAPILTGPSDSGFPLFIRAVTEGMALLVGLLAIETLFLGRGAYAALDPHPFWLPVILVALQYGLYGGVATAALASLLLDLPPRSPGVDISAYNLELTHLPIQWLLCALLIGLYRQNQRRTQMEQAKELAQLRRRNEAFAEEIQRLDEELWRFEVAAATASPAAPAAQRARGTEDDERDANASLMALRRASTHALPKEFARSVAGLLGVDNACLFLRKTGGEYVDVSEAGPCASLSGVLGTDHAIVGRALDSDAPFVIDRTDGAAGGVVAVAVRDQTAGRPLGLIAIPCDAGGEISVSVLEVLADATSEALTRIVESSRSEAADQLVGVST